MAPVQPIINEDFFIYEVDFLAVAAGAQAPQGTIQIQADSQFEWLKAAQFSDIAGAAETESGAVIPLATIQINDGTSGRNLFSNAVPIGNVFGSGRIPFVLPRGRIFQPTSIITVTVANYSAATAYNIRLSFIGRKLFRR